jgi:hypothetical protein
MLWISVYIVESIAKVLDRVHIVGQISLSACVLSESKSKSERIENQTVEISCPPVFRVPYTRLSTVQFTGT